MLDIIAQLGCANERAIGQVYRTLAACFPPESELRGRLTYLAASERAHAAALRLASTQLPAGGVDSARFLGVLRGQLDFLSVCLDLQDRLQEPSCDPASLVETLARLELSLTENLMARLLPLFDGEMHRTLEKLARESATHIDVLERILQTLRPPV